MSTCRAAVEGIQGRSEVMTENAKIRSNLDSMEARSPSEEFKFEVPKNPFVSPYYATDEALRLLPPVKIIVRN